MPIERIEHRLHVADAGAADALLGSRDAIPADARGEALAPERVEPAYLRNNVALTLEEQRALRAAR